MSRTRQRVTEPGMSPEEALNAIRASRQVFITVADCALVTGTGAVQIREQAREDARTGLNLLGYDSTVVKSRVSINRKSFLDFVEKGRKKAPEPEGHPRTNT